MTSTENNITSAIDTTSIYYPSTSAEAQAAIESGRFLTVYRKKSTFQNASDDDYWYSATNKDGNSIICKFKNKVPENLGSAFIIFNIMGNSKRKEVEVKKETYINFTYYITSCCFSDIPSEELPF